MSYIAPDTTIQLFADVDLDSNYENSIYFSSRTAQENWYNTRQRRTLTEQYYQRKDKNRLRINLSYYTMTSFRYMRFKNADFEDKWFYAFITEMTYVSNEVTEIEYKIDVLQTWLVGTDYDLDSCFVEREHTTDDLPFTHYVDEEIDCGEYVVRYAEKYNPFKSASEESAEQEDRRYCVMALSTTAVEIVGSDDTHVTLADRQISGAYYIAIEMSERQLPLIEQIVGFFNANPEDILSIYVAPYFTLPQMDLVTIKIKHSGQQFVAYKIPTDARPNSELVQFSGAQYLYRKNGTQVKNMRMYAYPFNFLKVCAPDGSNRSYRYEYWRDPESGSTAFPTFVAYSNITAPVKMFLQPFFYKGLYANNYLTEERIELGTLPICAWTSDAYKAWLTAQMPSVVVGTVSGALSGFGASAGATSPLHALLGGVSAGVSIANAIATTHRASIDRTESNGTASGNSVAFANNRYEAFAYQMSVDPEHIEMIDTYFSAFGYACKRVKKPNVKARQNWTYTKTIGCHIHQISGGYTVPVNDSVEIENIFNNGIRFFNNKAPMSDITGDNPPDVSTAQG